MLTSNIETHDININISNTQTIVVNLNKETGYLIIIDNLNRITGESNPLFALEICKEFNQPIILPDSLVRLKISGEFNQPIILPDSLELLKISENLINQLLYHIV